MLAGIDEATVSAIATKAPSLDFLSFQIYGEIDQLGQLLSRAGYDGPYLLYMYPPITFFMPLNFYLVSVSIGTCFCGKSSVSV